jgi:ketosteroid isomerase-like protein
MWKPVAGDMSLAGDLGYSYGSYELVNNTGDHPLVEKGYYLHVWKRISPDEWKIVADVTNPVEPETKE